MANLKVRSEENTDEETREEYPYRVSFSCDRGGETLALCKRRKFAWWLSATLRKKQEEEIRGLV